jgi:uncharacterized damage-inducible protein DinB
METQQQAITTAPTAELFIKIAISNWQLQNTRFNNILDKLTDEQLSEPTAPGRNTGVYLLGHLTAVSDGMLTLFELGDKLYPQLEQPFIKNPESAELEKPSIGELKEYWHNVNAVLQQKFDAMQAADWFTKHASISAEDFANEPHRNKLNILINRTVHQGYHMGQITYLVKK